MCWPFGREEGASRADAAAAQAAGARARRRLGGEHDRKQRSGGGDSRPALGTKQRAHVEAVVEFVEGDERARSRRGCEPHSAERALALAARSAAAARLPPEGGLRM